MRAADSVEIGSHAADPLGGVARRDRRRECGRELAGAPFRLVERVEVDDDRRVRRDVRHVRAEDVRPFLLHESGALPFDLRLLVGAAGLLLLLNPADERPLADLKGEAVDRGPSGSGKTYSASRVSSVGFSNDCTRRPRTIGPEIDSVTSMETTGIGTRMPFIFARSAPVPGSLAPGRLLRGRPERDDRRGHERSGWFSCEAFFRPGKLVSHEGRAGRTHGEERAAATDTP